MFGDYLSYILKMVLGKVFWLTVLILSTAFGQPVPNSKYSSLLSHPYQPDPCPPEPCNYYLPPCPDYIPYLPPCLDYKPYPLPRPDYNPYPIPCSDYNPYPIPCPDYNPYPIPCPDYKPYPLPCPDNNPYPLPFPDYNSYSIPCPDPCNTNPGEVIQIQPCNPSGPLLNYDQEGTPADTIVVYGGNIRFPQSPWTCLNPAPPQPMPIVIRPSPVVVPKLPDIQVQPEPVQPPSPATLIVRPPKISVPQSPTICFRPNPLTNFRPLGCARVDVLPPCPEPCEPCVGPVLPCPNPEPCPILLPAPTPLPLPLPRPVPIPVSYPEPVPIPSPWI